MRGPGRSCLTVYQPSRSSSRRRHAPGRYGSPSDRGERTSIDGDHRAGHVAGSRGEQEGCHTSELLRGSAPAKRVQRLVVASRAQLGGARGGNPCGHESVDSDTAWAELIGQRLGNHAESGAKAIGYRHPREGRPDRCREYERDGSVMFDRSSDGAGDPDRAEKDRLERAAPLPVIDVHDGTRWRPADADQCTVEAPEVCSAVCTSMSAVTGSELSPLTPIARSRPPKLSA